MIERGRPTDTTQRDAFLACERALAELTRTERRVAALQGFHARHKFLLLAAGRVHLDRCGQIAAHARQWDIARAFDAYAAELSVALSAPPRPGRVADTLTHMYGFLKGTLSPGEKHALLARIEDYRAGKIPLAVPLARLSCTNEAVGDEYLKSQVLFAAFPPLG